MRRTMRMSVCALLLAVPLSLTGCQTPFPEPPATVGEDFPDSGIPLRVSWPSDWLEGIVTESDAVKGSIVGLRLEHVEDRWVWRLRSTDPGYDMWGDTVTQPERGLESLMDASSHTVLKKRHVTLSDAELARFEVGYHDAARASGESYPRPRLIELERQIENGRPVWKITTYDSDTGTQSVLTMDASERSGD